MWYRTSKKILIAQNQGMPLRPDEDAIPFLPEELEDNPLIVQPPMEPIQKADDGTPKTPNLQGLSPEDTFILSLQPPLHERCHCYIERLPGGRSVWKTNETACDQCHEVRDRYNNLQSMMYGI